MQTKLRLDDQVDRKEQAEAAHLGRTIRQYIKEALRDQCQEDDSASMAVGADAQTRNERMRALLRRTARFRVGAKPTREEMNER